MWIYFHVSSLELILVPISDGIPLSFQMFFFILFPTCIIPIKHMMNFHVLFFLLLMSHFFNDPMDVGNLISDSSAFSQSSLNIWKFTVHILLKPDLENFENYFASMWDECNCVVVWTFFGIAFLWDWNENWSFPVLWPLLNFPNLLTYWVQHFHSIDKLSLV